MNLEKFTERSRGFIQAAQTIAMRESHQRVLPDHLLKALMDDDQGLASNLIRKAGGSSERVNGAINTSIAKLPKVTGVMAAPMLIRPWCVCWTRPRRWPKRLETALCLWSAC